MLWQTFLILCLFVQSMGEREKRHNFFGRRPGGNRPSIRRPSSRFFEGEGRHSGGVRVLFPIFSQPRTSQLQGRTCSGHETCTSFAECASYFQDLSSIEESQCNLEGSGVGLCCPNDSPSGERTKGVFTEPRLNIPVPDVTLEQLNNACKAALRELKTTRSRQRRIFSQGVYLQRNTPGAALLYFSQATETAIKLSEDGLANILSCQILFEELHLTPLQGAYRLQRFSVLDTIINSTCPIPPRCNPRSKYRTADGSCNNLAEPLGGRSNTAFERLLPPDYADGIFAPRVAESGRPLPSARLISTNLARDRDDPSQTTTLLAMQWGQFLAHDLTLAPVFKGEEGHRIMCCRDGRELPANLRNPACLPIEIPSNDPFFAQFGERCMEFVRSMVAPRPRCDFGYAEQLNAVTHFLDGSMVYGSEKETADGLRSFRGGKLKTQKNPRTGSDMMPPSMTEEDECSNFTQNIVCFWGGDIRTNEQIDLAVMHTIWVREHNRVAGQLARINRRWNDEILYQEARRIVIAKIEHITYNEWLPLIIGRDYLKLFGINARRTGFADIYNPSINPAVTNEFQSAAFRFGHTLLQGDLQLFNPAGRVEQTLKLETQMRNPFLLNNNNTMDFLTRGLFKQRSQKFDHFFTDSITNQLFQGNNQFGMDLIAINIQRAREHGIPGYNTYRELCGLPKLRSFSDSSGVVSKTAMRAFRNVYESVDDIDLFVGGVSESPRPGAVLGPTFACIVADTFARVRNGDRFTYDLRGQAGSFSEEQLDQIRRSSMARIICDNSDSINEIQPLPFLLPSRVNRPVDCSSNVIPRILLDPWIGERV